MMDLKSIIKHKDVKHKVVVNTNFGGFCLTKQMCDELHLEYSECHEHFRYDRSNPHLVALVEKFKPKDLEVIELTLQEILAAYVRDNDGKEKIVFNDIGVCKPLTDYILEKDL